MHLHHRLTGVIFRQRGRDLRRGNTQRRQIQRDHRLHARVVVGHNGDEIRCGVQPRDGGHLGQVLVVQRQAVGARGVQRLVGALGLVLGDHLFAAAAVAGQARHVQVRGLRDDPQLHQRRDGRDKAGGVAARHGDAGRGFQRLAGAVQLGQAVDPAGRGAVRRARVENAHIVPQQRHDLTRGVVRQAEEREVALIDDRRPCADILAVRLGDFQNFKFVPFRQPVRNAQTGGPGGTVHEDFVLSHCYTPYFQRLPTPCKRAAAAGSALIRPRRLGHLPPMGKAFMRAFPSHPQPASSRLPSSGRRSWCGPRSRSSGRWPYKRHPQTGRCTA